jgi:hypothetical protein
LFISIANVTAGLRWPPEIGPVAYTRTASHTPIANGSPLSPIISVKNNTHIASVIYFFMEKSISDKCFVYMPMVVEIKSKIYTIAQYIFILLTDMKDTIRKLISSVIAIA